MLTSITDLISEDAAYEFLKRHLHPQGLRCPNKHVLPKDQAPHMRDRDPIVDYKCRECGAVFGIFTGTALSGIRYDCRIIVLILRGIARGETAMGMARELGICRQHLLKVRHRLQSQLAETFSPLTTARQPLRGRRDVSKRR